MNEAASLSYSVIHVLTIIVIYEDIRNEYGKRCRESTFHLNIFEHGKSSSVIILHGNCLDIAPCNHTIRDVNKAMYSSN